MTRRPGRPEADDRGAIAVIAAIAMTMLLAATALSFDIGREVDTNRSVQAVADAVALDAADFLDGTAASAPDPYAPIGGTTYQLAQVVQYQAAESAFRNGVVPAAAALDQVVLGTCPSTTSCDAFTPVETCPLSDALATPALSASPGGTSCAPVAGAAAGTVINAVRVQARSTTSFVFAVGAATSIRAATAMRAFSPGAGTPPGGGSGNPPGGSSGPIGVSAFSLGATLLDFSNPLVDQVLSQELGTSTANISLLSYAGLAGADVSLGDILSANSSVGTLSQLLDTQVSPATALGWLYNALVAQNTSAATAAAGQLRTALGIDGTGAGSITAAAGVTLCQLVDLSGGASACSASGPALGPAAYAEFSAASFLTGVAAVSDEHHFVGIQVSGLGVLDAEVTAVSPEAVAGPGPADQPSCPAGLSPCPVTATNTQASVTLKVANLSLGVTSVSINLQVTGADATARLDGLSCGASLASESVTINGTSDAATVAPSFVVAGISLQGTTVSVGGGPFTATFNGPFGAGLPVAQSSRTTGPTITVAPPSSGSLGLLAGAVLTPLTTLLDTVLDPALPPVLEALGVNLGFATVADNYVNCAASVLVG